MLDTTNPDARIWMKNVMKKDMIEDSGSAGWMADFGEYLPFDAVLYDGQNAAEYHNIYPEEWAKINQEAVLESATQMKSHLKLKRKLTNGIQNIDNKNINIRDNLWGLDDDNMNDEFKFKNNNNRTLINTKHNNNNMNINDVDDDSNFDDRYNNNYNKNNNKNNENENESEFITEDREVVYFMRSAGLKSPKHTALFWLGDQLVSWDRHDGLKSAIVGALSGGIGGHSITHSDIGGYTMVRISTYIHVFLCSTVIM